MSKKKKEETMSDNFEGRENGATQSPEGQEVAGTTKEPKKAKKLGKSIEGNIVKISEGTTETVIEYDFDALPDAIKAKLGPFGLGHKLGDAAAGKSGQAAIDSINKVWEGLMKNDWSVRAPAAEKITKSTIQDNMEKLSDDEKDAAKALLARLGIKL